MYDISSFKTESELVDLIHSLNLTINDKKADNDVKRLCKKTKLEAEKKLAFLRKKNGK